MAARIPITTTTIISSMSVKPRGCRGVMSSPRFGVSGVRLRAFVGCVAGRGSPPAPYAVRLLAAREHQGQVAILATTRDLVLQADRVAVGDAAGVRDAGRHRHGPRGLREPR